MHFPPETLRWMTLSMRSLANTQCRILWTGVFVLRFVDIIYPTNLDVDKFQDSTQVLVSLRFNTLYAKATWISFKIALLWLIQQEEPSLVFFCHLRCRAVQRLKSQTHHCLFCGYLGGVSPCGLANFAKTCLFLIIMLPIFFCGQDNLLGGQFWAMDRLNLLGGQIILLGGQCPSS